LHQDKTRYFVLNLPGLCLYMSWACVNPLPFFIWPESRGTGSARQQPGWTDRPRLCRNLFGWMGKLCIL